MQPRRLVILAVTSLQLSSYPGGGGCTQLLFPSPHKRPAPRAAQHFGGLPLSSPGKPEPVILRRKPEGQEIAFSSLTRLQHKLGSILFLAVSGVGRSPTSSKTGSAFRYLSTPK